jgi:DNA recombination protein RmuC
MIEFGGHIYNFAEANTQIGIAVFVFGCLVLLLLVLALRAAGRSARAIEPVTQQIGHLGAAVEQLGQGQQSLAGGLKSVSEAQASAQMQVVQNMETRLADVQRQMTDTLHANALKSSNAMAEMHSRMNEVLAGNSEKTTKSLTQLQERLATIDKAQSNIEKLSGDVLSLQDILSNKQTRGAFGEIQLTDIVSKALPRDSFTMQATLSNNKRADCLIRLPNPPGPIVIDSKFPLEPYEKLRRAETRAELDLAARELRTAVRAHIKAISEKYIIEGETADGALMFLPSEAVYAELHANFPEIVREGFAARVWIVSPTTCMATLNTMRAVLKDARMREQAGAIRRELALLHGDVDRLVVRVDNLDRHFGQAAKDIADIRTSADKAGRRAKRLDSFDFEELSVDSETVVPLTKTPAE